MTTMIAKEIMSPNPLPVKVDTEVNEIIGIIDRNGVMMVPVVGNNEDGSSRLIGICSRSDILKEILNERFVTISRTRTLTTTRGEEAA
jgi:CBS domain-containing protein